MSKQRVGVFPAAGGIGGFTAKHLLTRLPAEKLCFVCRHPKNWEAAAASGVAVRYADYDNQESLEAAFVGLESLFLISYATVEIEWRTKVHSRAIDIAIKNGVKHIFYGSLGFSGTTDTQETAAHVMVPHLETEKYLEKCAQEHAGFSYTIIREGLYSESFPLYTSFFNVKKPVDLIKIPHDGSGPGIAWVKREELGEGSAEIISRYTKEPAAFVWNNSTVLLNGPKALTLKESIDILSEVTNTKIQIQQVSDEEFAAQPQLPANLTYRGVDYSLEWASSFEGFRRGEAAAASSFLAEILGREPEDFRTTVIGLRNSDGDGRPDICAGMTLE